MTLIPWPVRTFTLCVAALVEGLARGLPQPPTPPQEAPMKDRVCDFVDAALARWRGGAPEPGPWAVVAGFAQPGLGVATPWGICVCIDAEHQGPVEHWPRFWLLPGGAEEPSARERTGR